MFLSVGNSQKRLQGYRWLVVEEKAWKGRGFEAPIRRGITGEIEKRSETSHTYWPGRRKSTNFGESRGDAGTGKMKKRDLLKIVLSDCVPLV